MSRGVLSGGDYVRIGVVGPTKFVQMMILG